MVWELFAQIPTQHQNLRWRITAAACFVLLLTGVMIALYGGYATPSETAGLGAVLAQYGLPSRLYPSATAFSVLVGPGAILAAIGVYGAISYLVTQGAHDIGVRIALGASRGNILKMVVRRGMGLAGTGIVCGLIGAALLTQVMASLLFGVSAHDIAAFTAAPLFLAVVALAACYVPARRATRVDPMVPPAPVTFSMTICAPSDGPMY